MGFLTYKESQQVQKLLSNSTLLQTADAEHRSAMLINCGLEEYCSELPLNGIASHFATVLYSKLSKSYVTIDNSPRLGLVVFLEYISWRDLDLSEDEKNFINHAIAKWERQQTSNLQKSQITDMLSQARASRLSAPLQQSIKVDWCQIVNYDLERLMATFRQQVRTEGAFVFVVGGDYMILEQYVIERICWGLKQKTGRQNERKEIRLYRESIVSHTDIKRKLIDKYQMESCGDLFKTRWNPDLVLIIWNYDIPQKIIKSLAPEFWTDIRPSVLPNLQNQSRCLVIVWAHINIKRPWKVPEFTVLPLPKAFDLCELVPWFRGQLKMAGIGDDRIDDYLKRLKNQCGNLSGTYQEMNQIVQELQGGTQFYG